MPPGNCASGHTDPSDTRLLNYQPTSISGTSSRQGTDIREYKGSQTRSSGSGGDLGFSQRSRCFSMRLMTEGCSMKEMTFIYLATHSGGISNSCHGCVSGVPHITRTYGSWSSARGVLRLLRPWTLSSDSAGQSTSLSPAISSDSTC